MTMKKKDYKLIDLGENFSIINTLVFQSINAKFGENYSIRIFARLIIWLTYENQE